MPARHGGGSEDILPLVILALHIARGEWPHGINHQTSKLVHAGNKLPNPAQSRPIGDPLNRVQLSPKNTLAGQDSSISFT